MPADCQYILLIEDSSAYARLIKSLFSESSEPRYVVHHAATLRAGLEGLQAGGVDVVLLDLTLPDAEGLESFRQVRAASPETPIIVLTGLASGQLASTAVKEGAQDYLTKRDINRSALMRCVRYAIDRHNAELELAQARKMESIGQLAAGIAHEINTPVQYIGDSIVFLRDCFADLMKLHQDCAVLCDALRAGAAPEEALDRIRERREEIEMDYLEAEIPKAFARASEGVGRVAEVVGAMREFSHPSDKNKEPADLNRAIQNTLTIARSQFRYVADVATDLGELPKVACHIGEINQVLLNLIVNAAQSIEDAGKGESRRGLITVRSRAAGGHVRIEVTDDGVGVRDEIRERVFDPFFTTKEVGRGTGQGLALALTSIVKHHAGKLDFESRPGEGATFWFSLPVDLEEEAPQRPSRREKVGSSF